MSSSNRLEMNSLIVPLVRDMIPCKLSNRDFRTSRTHSSRQFRTKDVWGEDIAEIDYQLHSALLICLCPCMLSHFSTISLINGYSWIVDDCLKTHLRMFGSSSTLELLALSQEKYARWSGLGLGKRSSSALVFSAPHHSWMSSMTLDARIDLP
jgi:hypothetical protein